MRKILIVLILALVAIQSSWAEELGNEPERARGKWWKLSAIALVAGTSVDAHSSWGHAEVNPALRGPNGRFGVQGIAIKGLIAGGVLGAQYMLLRNNPKAYRYGAITNFAMSGLFSGAAVYNYRLHAAKPAISPSSPR